MPESSAWRFFDPDRGHREKHRGPQRNTGTTEDTEKTQRATEKSGTTEDTEKTQRATERNTGTTEDTEKTQRATDFIALEQFKKISLAILASGNGTNAEAILKHFQNHERISVALVLSNNPVAMVLERAGKFKVPIKVFSRLQFRVEVVSWLKEAGITHIILAGFLWLIPESLIKAYPAKIINIHPSLLPRHGGKGMYGHAVHEAVKNSGDKETGITIHLVNERFDEGKIIFQTSCPLNSTDTPDSIIRLSY